MSLEIETKQPFLFFTNANRQFTLQDLQEIFPSATRFTKLLSLTGLLVTGTSLAMYAVWAGFEIQVKPPVFGTVVLCRTKWPFPGQNYRAEENALVPTSMIAAYADYRPDSNKGLDFDEGFEEK